MLQVESIVLIIQKGRKRQKCKRVLVWAGKEVVIMNTDRRRKTERGREFVVKVMNCVCTSLLRNSWGAEEPERVRLK